MLVFKDTMATRGHLDIEFEEIKSSSLPEDRSKFDTIIKFYDLLKGASSKPFTECLTLCKKIVSKAEKSKARNLKVRALKKEKINKKKESGEYKKKKDHEIEKKEKIQNRKERRIAKREQKLKEAKGGNGDAMVVEGEATEEVLKVSQKVKTAPQVPKVHKKIVSNVPQVAKSGEFKGMSKAEIRKAKFAAKKAKKGQKSEETKAVVEPVTQAIKKKITEKVKELKKDKISKKVKKSSPVDDVVEARIIKKSKKKAKKIQVEKKIKKKVEKVSVPEKKVFKAKPAPVVRAPVIKAPTKAANPAPAPVAAAITNPKGGVFTGMNRRQRRAHLRDESKRTNFDIKKPPKQFRIENRNAHNRNANTRNNRMNRAAERKGEIRPAGFNNYDKSERAGGQKPRYNSQSRYNNGPRERPRERAPERTPYSKPRNGVPPSTPQFANVHPQWIAKMKMKEEGEMKISGGNAKIIEL